MSYRYKGRGPLLPLGVAEELPRGAQPEATQSETKHLSLMGPALCAGVCEVLSSEKFSGHALATEMPGPYTLGNLQREKTTYSLGVPSE